MTLQEYWPRMRVGEVVLAQEFETGDPQVRYGFYECIKVESTVCVCRPLYGNSSMWFYKSLSTLPLAALDLLDYESDGASGDERILAAQVVPLAPLQCKCDIWSGGCTCGAIKPYKPAW